MLHPLGFRFPTSISDPRVARGLMLCFVLGLRESIRLPSVSVYKSWCLVLSNRVFPSVKGTIDFESAIIERSLKANT